MKVDWTWLLVAEMKRGVFIFETNSEVEEVKRVADWRIAS